MTQTNTLDIQIRPLAAGDASLLFDAVCASMTSLSYWFPWCSSDYSLADAEARIAYCLAARESGDEFAFGIFDASGSTLLGCVGLSDVQRDADGARGSANLGYWLGEAQRGKDIATAAAAMAASFGFDELGLSRIDIATLPHNQASQRVAEKLGALPDPYRQQPQQQRTLDFQGEAVGAIVYSLTPERLCRR